jgi:hypothetical protein
MLRLPVDALPSLVPAPAEPVDAESYVAMSIARQQHLVLAHPTEVILKAQLREVEYQLEVAGQEPPRKLQLQRLDLRRRRARMAAVIAVSEVFVAHADEHFPGCRAAYEAYCQGHAAEIGAEIAACVASGLLIVGQPPGAIDE